MAPGQARGRAVATPAAGVVQGLTPGIAYIVVTSGGRRDSARITVR